MKDTLKKSLLIFVSVVFTASLSCYSVRKRTPVPFEYIEEVQIPGIPRARFWGDDIPPWMKDEKSQPTISELKEKFPDSFHKPHYYLAISGGGANGAYGAGILSGWTEEGSRPEFTIVTGVSTGALTAPFAFLGSKYDETLKEVYTTITTDDVLEKRMIFALLRADAMANSQGLRRLIAKYIDETVMSEIAVEHDQGKRLFVGTTNLDSGRPVIWNLGIIAKEGTPRSLELIRDILLASASIPGVFPPVYFDVEANGKHYDEMHVDGGAASQVFLYPAALDWRKVLKQFQVKKQPEVFILRNSWVKPHYKAVQPKVFPIMGQSVSTLIRTQGMGDLYRIYLGTLRDQLDYNLAYIPESFPEDSPELFDPKRQNPSPPGKIHLGR